MQQSNALILISETCLLKHYCPSLITQGQPAPVKHICTVTDAEKEFFQEIRVRLHNLKPNKILIVAVLVSNPSKMPDDVKQEGTAASSELSLKQLLSTLAFISQFSYLSVLSVRLRHK